MKRSDYRTINYFRGKRLKESFESVFTQLMELLHKQGFVTLNVQYIDGTKIESSANKYTFVWRGTVEKYDARLKDKTAALLKQIEESHDLEEPTLPYSRKMDVEDFSRRMENIKQQIDEQELSRAEQKTIRTIETGMLPYVKYNMFHGDGWGKNRVRTESLRP